MRENRPKTIASLVFLTLILGTCVFHIGAWRVRAAERGSSDAQEQLYQELREKLVELTRAKRGGVDAQAEDAPEEPRVHDVAESDATRKAGALTTLDINGVKVNFHWAPAGSFMMGSPQSEAWRRAAETLHEVTLTQGFWIAETETTQELWQAVMGDNPSRYKDSKRLPVESVSWNDCRDFVEKLNSSYRNALPRGYKYALPTEAQWEYACRAGTTTPFNFGSVLNGDKANCNGTEPYGTDEEGKFLQKPTPVKSYEANA